MKKENKNFTLST